MCEEGNGKHGGPRASGNAARGTTVPVINGDEII